MMPQRIFSTVVLWIVLLLALYLFRFWGGVFLALLFAAPAMVESRLLFRRAGFDFPLLPVFTAGLAHLLLTAFASFYGWFREPLTVSAGLAVASLVIWNILFYDPRMTIRNLLPGLLTFLLIPFCLSFYLLLAGLPSLDPHGGLFLAAWLVLVVKFCDIGALLGGMRFGRTPLAPNYSPKKTVEGAVAGLITSVVAGVLLVVFSSAAPVGLIWIYAAIVAFLVGVVGIFSDLLGSALKRFAKTKDSGVRIPGIGGAIDLVDSLLLAGPVGFLLLSLIVF